MLSEMLANETEAKRLKYFENFVKRFDGFYIGSDVFDCGSFANNLAVRTQQIPQYREWTQTERFSDTFVIEIIEGLGIRELYNLFNECGRYSRDIIRREVMNRVGEIEVTDSSSSEVIRWCKSFN